MSVRDHDPISFSQFLGTFDRGDDETVPPGYFRTSQNVAFARSSVFTREGSTLHTAFGYTIRRIAIYKRIGEAPRLLILDTAGRLFDSTNPTVPILTIPGMVDFTMVSMFNRAYITPHDGITGLPGEKIYVYEGSGVARPAGGEGPPPNNRMTVAEGDPGNFDSGIHLWACAFETQSGHVSKFGAFTDGWSGTGGKKWNISAIPTGPVGTVARVLIGTKAASVDSTGSWDNNYKSKEWYFIPDGRIPDNVTTTKTVEYFDADLQASADYLTDQLGTIPAGVGVNVYRGRLISWGENANPSIVRASESGLPESFSEIEGFATVNPGDGGGGIKYCFEYRTQLVCCKTQRSYITMDNGNSAALWEVNALDKSVGTEPHGVGKILDYGEDVRDRAFVADRSGLQLFIGTFADTEISENIADIWDRINKAQFHKVEVAVDPLKMRVYITVPLDNAVECTHMIVGDWADGLNVEGTKFTLWKFPHNPSTVVVDVNQADKESLMKYGTLTANDVYALNEGVKLDLGVAIDSWVEFPLLPQDDDWPVNHFTGARMRVRGMGNLNINLSGVDDVQKAYAPSLPLSVAPGRALFRGWNFTGERCSVKLGTNLANEYFALTHISIYYKKLWATRPE